MLKTLRSIIEEVENTPKLVDALSVLVQRVRQALETEACSIFLVDNNSHDFVLLATDGLNKALINHLRINMHEGLIGLIAEQEKPLNLEDAPSHPRYFHVEGSGEEVFHAFLGVPIINNRRLLGILMIEQREKRSFDEEEEAFLVTIAVQLGDVLARVGLSDLIEKQAHEGTNDNTLLQGLPSGPGIGIGQAVVIYPLADLDVVPDKIIDDIEEEITKLNDALETVKEEIRMMEKKLSPSLPKAERDLFSAYIRLLDRDSLGKEIIAIISEGHWAQSALKRVIQKRVRQFEAMDDHYLRERASDIRDLGQRVLSHLQQHHRKKLEYPDNTILMGDELSAGDIASVPTGKLKAVISAKGSSNSHVFILTRALGIPAVSGVHNMPLATLDGKTLIVDGHYGHVYVSPTESLLQEFLDLAQAEKLFDENLQSLRELPAETLDGHRIQLLVNAGLAADAGMALAAGSEGVGLFRTEVPFMTRERFPSEEEQRVIYRQVLSAFAPRQVVMRTLDVGGDKPLSYFPIEEDNPFLGWRGIRISLDHPELFQSQIRAMLEASRGLNNLQILLPMISSVREFDQAKILIEHAYDEINAQEPLPKPKIGAMIEVPSAIYEARKLAKRADFLSIGSNDLTQYLLAVDRNNARVSSLYDSYHPAVLHSLHQIVRSARLENTPVGICGELAGDPIVTLLLIAMGFTSLSASPNNLLRIKSVIRHFSMAQAKKILSKVMKYEHSSDIRTELESVLDKAGLSALIRSGG